MSDPVLIRAVGLTKVYGDGHKVEVFRGLDAEIARGHNTVIVGPSGVGKSTLLHLLGALDRATSGTVLFDGIELSSLGDFELAQFRNQKIGFVFQFHHLLADFSAVENVMMPALIRGMKRAEAEALARNVLERVGLGHRLDHRPGELSGGEQQRVAIARAIVLSPMAILADEPTGNLDEATAEGVHELLVELNREHGTTLVIVTHNERLMALADHCLRLEHGRIVMER